MLLLLKKTEEIAPKSLILPGNPLFHWTLGTVMPPTEDKSVNYVFRKDSLVAEAVDEADLDEYLEGGEYDEIMDDSCSESDILYLPCSMEFD